MKPRILATVLLATGLSLGMAIHAEEKQPTTEQPEVKKQTTCPVMGGRINQKQFVDVKGKRIYVCCAGCIGQIKADPDKYIQQMEAEGVTPENAPAPKETEKKDS